MLFPVVQFEVPETDNNLCSNLLLICSLYRSTQKLQSLWPIQPSTQICLKIGRLLLLLKLVFPPKGASYMALLFIYTVRLLHANSSYVHILSYAHMFIYYLKLITVKYQASL